MFDRDYELFAAIVETGSLSAAGRKLRLSPGMMSKRLSALESRLGAQLIHRTTRRLVLTSAGETFHEDVLAILAAAQAAEARVAGRPDPMSGALRVSAPTSFGRLYVAPYLRPFLDEHPRIELQLDLSDTYTDLVAERVDVAIRIAGAIGAGLDGHQLGASPRILCASPDYLQAHPEPESVLELARHHLLAAAGQTPWRLDGPDGPVVVQGESRVRTNSSEVVRELTLAGAGIALRSLWDVQRDIAAGRLVRVMPAYSGSAEAAIYAVHPRTPLAPARVAAFIDYLRALYSPVAPWEA